MGGKARAKVMTISAIIVAAGKGERLGGTPKQFRLLGGKPVLRWAVEALARHPAVRRTRVVIGTGQQELAAAALDGLDVGEPVEGGAERADSVRAGLAEVEDDAVLVHDAARPFCPHDVIDRLVAALEFHDGAAPVVAVSDTIARSGGRARRAGRPLGPGPGPDSPGGAHGGAPLGLFGLDRPGPADRRNQRAHRRRIDRGDGRGLP